jgi:hypothetical protein
MENVRALLLAIIALFATSCYSGYDSSLDDDPPYNAPFGDFSYVSQSVYFDDNQNEVKRRELGGAINFDPNNNFEMRITPLRGWVYSLEVTSFAAHVLSDNSVVYSFNVGLQSVDLNNETFNVQGLRSLEIRDPDGTLIGTYDGIMESNGTMKLSYFSLDYVSDETTRTNITATPY